MINPNVFYRATGRYMDGQNLYAYHLVGEDGSESIEGKESIIWLISQGIITNMRTQPSSDNEIIIRGKGVNLNNLPVININKLKNKDTNVSGKHTILRRIVYNGQCLGYEVKDPDGNVKRKKRDQVIQLAVQHLVSNATAHRYTKPGSDKPEIALSGVECDLRRLPLLIVNEQGKIVDPKADKSTLTVRSVYLKHAGVLHDNSCSRAKQFKSGDYIICNPDGSMDIQNRIAVEKNYKRDYERGNATCDDYVGLRNQYSLEIFGGSLIDLTPNVVKSWAILKPHLMETK